MLDFAIKVEAQQLNRLLYSRKLTVATAESCTSGGIASAIAAIPGSSDYFKGGLVAYATAVKENYLGVSPETIAAHTVVSEEVVRGMVQGACAMFGTSFAVATSGVAGPTGGTPDIPVGTIWIAAGTASHIKILCLHGNQGRSMNVENAILEALRLLLDVVRDSVKYK